MVGNRCVLRRLPIDAADVVKPDQILMGTAIAIMCATVGISRRWFLENTRKGQWLVDRLGPAKASRVLGVLSLAGVVFGILLAMSIVNPVRWS